MEEELKTSIFHMQQRIHDLNLPEDRGITVLNPYSEGVIHLHLTEGDIIPF